VLVILAAVWVGGAFSAAPISYWAYPIILEFGAGMGLAHLFLRGWRLSAPIAGGFIAVGCVAAFVLGPLETYMNRVVILGLPAILIVCGFALAPAPRRPSAYMLFERVGDASYSLYLSHPFVITAVFIVWSRLPLSGAVDMFGYVLLTMLLTVVWSILSFHWIEKPASRLVRGWLRGRRKAQVVTTAP
jgi:peptidoglycan/LPS O-acetylase OafA/YrhL